MNKPERAESNTPFFPHEPDPELKEKINNFLWVTMPGETTLETLEEMACKILFIMERIPEHTTETGEG